MAYSTSNPPRLVDQAITGIKTWEYVIAGDAGTVVDASGYFTDGYALGMRVGDVVRSYNSTSKIWTSHVVVTANATTGVIDLSNGTTIADGSSNSD